MTLRLGSVVLHVDDVHRAGRFWQAALGLSPHPDNTAFLRGADGVELHLDDEDATHLDLWTVATDDLAAEVERLLSLGARRADWTYPPDADFVVLHDTEGNTFCVVAAER